MNIGYFGKPFSFSHVAALRRFGKKHEYFQRHSIEEALDMLKINDDFSVVPAENSICGGVTETVDALCSKKYLNKISIVEELEMNIELYLIGRKKFKFKDIKKIYSHEYPLKISKNWIEKNIPNTKLERTSSTSDAASYAGRTRYSAALASKEAAKHYHLKEICKIINGEKKNITRFYVFKQGGCKMKKSFT